MQKFVTIFHPDIDGGRSVSEVTRVPELVKAHPEGCSRSALFTCDDQKSPAGPLTLVFAIRRARDLLLENCEYNGVDLQLEVSGRTLPQLPAARELEKLLNSPDTLVHVNGNVFKLQPRFMAFSRSTTIRCAASKHCANSASPRKPWLFTPPPKKSASKCMAAPSVSKGTKT